MTLLISLVITTAITLITEMLMRFILLLATKTITVAYGLLNVGNGNLFESLAGFLPALGSVNLLDISRGIAYGVVVLLMMASIIRSYLNLASGEEAENPAKAVGRAIISTLLIVLFYGSNTYVFSHNGDAILDVYNSGGLLGLLGTWFSDILALLGDIPDISAWDAIRNDNIFINLICEGIILKYSVEAAVSFIQRIFMYGIYVMFGHIALAMSASKDTENIAREWVVNLFSQFLALFISIAMWKVFAITLSDGLGNFTDVFKCMAALAVVSNSEKILNAMGFKAVGSPAAGRRMVAAMAGFPEGAKHIAETSYHNSLHGNSPVISGVKSFLGIKDAEKPVVPSQLSAGVQPLLKEDGSFAKPVEQTKWGKPTEAYLNQQVAYKSVKESLDNRQAMSVQHLSNAIGLSENANMQIIGEGGMASYARTDSDIEGASARMNIENGDGSVRSFIGFTPLSEEPHEQFPAGTTISVTDPITYEIREMETTTKMYKPSPDSGYIYELRDKKQPSEQPPESDDKYDKKKVKGEELL